MKQPIVTEVSFWDVIADIDAEMTRLSWDIEQGKAYLKANYGTHTRFRLNDEQLLGFRDYLISLPDKQVISLKLCLKTKLLSYSKRR